MKKSRQGSTSLLDDPEYMREQVLERTDREEIDAETLEQFNRRLDAVLNEELSNITETAEYQAESGTRCFPEAGLRPIWRH